jgi:hypothetical protein
MLGSRPSPKPVPYGATTQQAWRAPRPATVQYCSHSLKIAGEAWLRAEQYCSAKRRGMDQYSDLGRSIEQEPK